MGLICWFLVLLLKGLVVVVAMVDGSFDESSMRAVLWLPVGVGVGLWAARKRTVSRWLLAMGSLVFFSLAVVGLVRAMFTGGGIGEIVLQFALIVLCFQCLKVMVWDRDAKAYVRQSEEGESNSSRELEK